MAKKQEVQQQQAPTVIVAQQPKIAFDAWWAMNEKKIPSQHYKEIVWADFRGRGLSTKETVQTYNNAIKRYGLKLK